MMALLKLGYEGEFIQCHHAVVRLFGCVHFTVLHAVASLPNKLEPLPFLTDDDDHFFC